MSFYKRLSIFKKLLLGLVVTTILVISTTLFLFLSIKQAKVISENSNNKYVQIIKENDIVKSIIIDQQALVLKFVASPDDQTRNEIMNNFRYYDRSFNQEFKILKIYLGNEQTNLLQNVQYEHDSFSYLVNNLFTHYIKGNNTVVNQIVPNTVASANHIVKVSSDLTTAILDLVIVIQHQNNSNILNTTVFSVCLTLMGLLISIILTYFVAIGIKRSITELISVTNKVADGDLGHKVNTDSRDEIGQLAQSFNSMIDELSESQSELRIAHDNLEKRVDERTQELSDVNALLEEEIQERIDREEEIYKLAYHDQLTGLPNRRLFYDRLEQSILQAVRNEKSFEILFLDLDGFKMINDTMGHAQGDELLKKVAERLSNTLRKSDVIARVGGDEFLILIHNAPNKESIEKVCQNVINAIKEPFKFPNSEIFITTSIGVSIYPQDGEDVETLVKNADIAMYVAKESGKGRFAFCNEQIKKNLDEVMILTNDLYRALDAHELELYYQPQVAATSGLIVGLEALLRWNHPKLGLIGPVDFIPIAEKTGLIMVIGEWVLRTACFQTKAWQDSGFPNLSIAVNLSVNQIESRKLVKQVSNILIETGLNPKNLELEITESIFMKDINEIADTLNELKSLEIRIAIDDFGTDYSSLSYLKQLPLDRIKIPKTFIDGINKNISDESIISAIIVLGKKLGLDLIAEGVETDQQLQFLKSELCDEIQGYYYHRPMPAKEIERILRVQYSFAL